ncbi:IclR family transcriptional regulator [Rhodovulum sp. 12E13]|uniref:IclR family transcriptional regulator n=1 Tax=Rhodovulum sp. 12E13 TaxID=2203891 RepID=UPI000E1517B5|nr:IclR family transcriptional regulator [Rhodovulum sp. 12E13]RDC71038.1 IclR family transcriptional regulator [Rhodovulum sp. 12E13]
MDGDKRETIPTTLRLLFVVEEVARAGGPVTPTEVNLALGLPKPTIHRLFATLEQEGFVERDMGGRGYAPGPRLRALAGGVLVSAGLRTARQAILQRVAHSVGETCNLAVPDGDAMVYLERIETEWPLRIQLPIGSRVPLHCTAGGKLFLASLPPAERSRALSALSLSPNTAATLTAPQALATELETVRAQGHAVDRQEFMDGMIALAVPVTDARGRLMATLSFHAPTQRVDEPAAMAHLETLHAAAAELAALVA